MCIQEHDEKIKKITIYFSFFSFFLCNTGNTSFITNTNVREDETTNPKNKIMAARHRIVSAVNVLFLETSSDRKRVHIDLVKGKEEGPLPNDEIYKLDVLEGDSDVVSFEKVASEIWPHDLRMQLWRNVKNFDSNAATINSIHEYLKRFAGDNEVAKAMLRASSFSLEKLRKRAMMDRKKRKAMKKDRAIYRLRKIHEAINALNNQRAVEEKVLADLSS